MASRNEMNGIFDEITSVGVDYDLLVRRFHRRKLPVSTLTKELTDRGFNIEVLGKNKQKVYPPELD